MNIIDFLRVLRANRLVILGCAALGLAMGLLYSLLQPTLYTATSTAFVTVEGEASISGTETAQTRAQSYIPLINSRTVRERIAAEGLDTAGATMSAALVPNSNLITVSAVAPDAQQAAALANGALVATADVANELDPTSNVTVTAMEDALAPAAPSSPDRVRHLLYGLGAGLVLGLVVAFLRRLLDVNVRTTTDAQVAGGAGLLGAIPLDPSMKAERTAPMAPLSPRASEAVRQLRTNLRFAAVDDPPRTIAFTSSNPGEGKSTTIANLALTLAKSGSRVCLVEGDLRRPRLLDYLGLDGSAGLTDVLIDRAHLDDVLQPYGRSGLDVLGAGAIPPNPSELLGSESMRAMLEDLRGRFDYVIIDAPPLLPVTDAAVLSRVTDGTLVTGQNPASSADAARRLLDLLTH